MKIINTLINLTIATALLVMLYTQYTFVKADWCSWEIEKALFTLENIEMKLNE